MDCWIIAQLSTPLPASEGSGDSDQFAGDHGLLFMQGKADDEDDEEEDNNDHDDDNDAESCSYDSYDRAQEHVSDDDGVESEGYGGNDDDDEEGVFVWLPKDARGKIREEKEVKMVDSEEDDRLFWETCLATGY